MSFGDNKCGVHDMIVISNSVGILALLMLLSFLLSFDFLTLLRHCSMKENVQSGDMCLGLKFKQSFL